MMILEYFISNTNQWYAQENDFDPRKISSWTELFAGMHFIVRRDYDCIFFKFKTLGMVLRTPGINHTI